MTEYILKKDIDKGNRNPTYKATNSTPHECQQECGKQ